LRIESDLHEHYGEEGSNRQTLPHRPLITFLHIRHIDLSAWRCFWLSGDEEYSVPASRLGGTLVLGDRDASSLHFGMQQSGMFLDFPL